MESQAKSHDKETSPTLSRTCYQKLPQNWGGEGGAWVRVSYSTKVLYGEATPRDPTPYPFIYHFRQKRYPFHLYLLLTDGAPFTIPSSEFWVYSLS